MPNWDFLVDQPGRRDKAFELGLNLSVYNVRKLHFQANVYKAFAEDKKQHNCGDLV